jgi:peptidoglycan/xylan/chitin deacetylase (PgdA/CDA1 family)
MIRNPRRRDRLLVLGWHNVEQTWSFPAAPGAGVKGLESQFKLLARYANVVPLAWGLERLKRGDGLPSRAVAVTFDDGYLDTVTLALPLLDTYKLPATFFLVPEFLSDRSRPWWEELGWAVMSATASSVQWRERRYALTNRTSRRNTYTKLTTLLQFQPSATRREGLAELRGLLKPTGDPPNLMMGWDEARTLVKRGFDVQSHTESHPVLSMETAEQQGRELQSARDELESELSVRVSSVAYPHGTTDHYNSDTIEAVGSAGYEWGLTTVEGFCFAGTPEFELRRCITYPQRGAREIFSHLRHVLRPE